MKTKLSKTRNKIIKVAQSVFTEISVYKATMSDIASAAKVSRRTLYTHFKSKEEIYRYVVDYEVELINQKLQKAADSSLPPERKLKLYILARFNAIDNLVKKNRYIRHDFLFNNMRVEQLRKKIDAKEYLLLTEIIKEGKEKNIFRVSTPASFAKTLVIMFKSLEQPFILTGVKAKNYQTLMEYVDFMFYGILNNNNTNNS